MTHVYKCPDCGSERLIVSEVTKYTLNGHYFYRHSVKTHDSDADVECLQCEWFGIRRDLGE
jgi:transcription elongation factor Elf1